MSAEQTDTVEWYFCFRQTRPSPPGSWIAEGPYNTYEEAKAAREAAKAWDAEVSTPFRAYTKEEAQEKCDTGRTF